jgi:hypothetical protein
MTSDEWNALARRCGEATGADRELDRAIHGMLGNEGLALVFAVPFYTRSLDAITALIERELPAYGWEVVRWRDDPGTPCASLMWSEGDEFHSAGVLAATPALALAAAFCRAMTTKEPTP